jgi:hypothetical protein
LTQQAAKIAFSARFGAFLQGPGADSTSFDAVSRDAPQLTHQITVLPQPYPRATGRCAQIGPERRKGSGRDPISFDASTRHARHDAEVASGAPNLIDALSHDADILSSGNSRRADAFDAAIQGSRGVSRTTRWTTLVPTPSVLAILRMPSPLARCSLIVASMDGLTLRRPSFVPF